MTCRDIINFESLGSMGFVETVPQQHSITLRPKAPKLQMATSIHPASRPMHALPWAMLHALPESSLLARRARRSGAPRKGAAISAVADWNVVNEFFGEAATWFAGLQATAISSVQAAGSGVNAETSTRPRLNVPLSASGTVGTVLVWRCRSVARVGRPGVWTLPSR
jgi:hypothetical protein